MKIIATAARVATVVAVVAASTGCASALAGRPTAGASCALAQPAATAPGPDSQPLIRIGWLSVWTPVWAQMDSVIVYTDGTAVGANPERPDDLTASSPSSPATSPATSPNNTAAPLEAAQGGWIDDCELSALLDQGADLAGTNMGRIHKVMDASSAQVWIAASDGRPETKMSVYALGVDDDDGDELTSAQRQARTALSAWLTAVRAAIHPTGALPVDRIRLVEPGRTSMMGGDDPGRPVVWKGSTPFLRDKDEAGESYSKSCAVLTGKDAANAMANLAPVQTANGDRKAPFGRGVFLIDGKLRYFAMMALAPGENCR
jgi:hypothetical protein